jgi:5-methylcytosine-specific restriction endonuclease McrA
MIPIKIKIEVWARDRGRCAICGATEELHFDHILPTAKEGSDLSAENIQLICARHNFSRDQRSVKHRQNTRMRTKLARAAYRPYRRGERPRSQRLLPRLLLQA